MRTFDKKQWVRVRRGELCKVCGKGDYCTRSADGALARCMRVESGKPSKSRDGSLGWIHVLSEPLPQANLPEKRPAPKIDAAAAAKSMFEHQKAAAKRAEVAAKLGVSVESLEQLRVGIGWDWQGHEFASFPSRDGEGRIVGVTRRYSNGEKKTLKGTSNAGVFVVANWWQRPGPVWLVEGASDTATLLSEGLCVIGRPSNTGGANVIRRLLARHRRRAVIVIGEHDEKIERRGTVAQCPVDCGGCSWCAPGLSGAREVARQLRCEWLMPPDGIKDVREWRRLTGVGFAAALFGRTVKMDGPELLRNLDQIAADVHNYTAERDARQAEMAALQADVAALRSELTAVRGTLDKLIGRLKDRFQGDTTRTNGQRKPAGRTAEEPKQCPIRGCKRTYRGDKVMCGFHWYRVPKEIRDRVWNEYKAENGSIAHRRAVAEAIASVQQDASVAGS